MFNIIVCEISPLLLGNVALRMSNLQVNESRSLCLPLGYHNKRTAPSRNSSRSSKRGRGKEKPQDKEVEGGHERNNRGTVNTIVGGFSGAGSTSSARRRYSRSNQSCNMVGVYAFKEHPQLAFTFNDFEGMYPHDDDPLVIYVFTVGFQIKRTIVDTGSSANVLFWEVFKKLDLPKEVMREHRGFAGELMSQ
ncbi:hypothetical protein MTR_3g044903 [Medicago truncatula]|uniref:Uncharacterized protein n=1 Tax=Medicago truncatula TaxID=3880 RepID=A0A072UWS6_MEDTR|nr:hypothetical protein MTR_3g044903 [Medicago truncatula]